MTAETSEGEFVLDAELLPGATEPLFEALREARGKPFTIDAANVEHIGAQCAQLLLVAKQTWEADGHAITFSNPSESFCESLKVLGIFDAICSPEEVLS